jgi:hypothetical protein
MNIGINPAMTGTAIFQKLRKQKKFSLQPSSLEKPSYKRSELWSTLQNGVKFMPCITRQQKYKPEKSNQQNILSTASEARK